MLDSNNHSIDLIGACEILDHMPDVFLLVDQRGRIAMVNASIETLLGWQPKEIIGVELEILLPPEARQSHMQIRDRFFKVPIDRDMNERIDMYGWHKKGYSVPVDIKLTATLVDDVLYGVAVVRDDSNRRKLLAELEEKNTGLEQSISEKNRLLGVAAHDLRNPIGVIQNFSQILHSKSIGPLTEDQEEFVHRIYESSVFLLGLLEDMLDVSTIESGSMSLDQEDFLIGELLDKTIASSIISARSKSIELEANCAKIYLLTMFADKNKIYQVIHNLIDNAIKYSPNNSSVKVDAEIKDNNLCIDVIDHGVGISEDELGNLFQPFFRATNKPTNGEKSTGLGLFIAKRIVEAHHGTLTVESENGVGSKFSVCLPLNINL